uniref:Conserved oligomeric Golgi complex subunit 6 n=1 Tax=Lutzomyia longipalpis TaxID=7200 RepID=A0A7G3ADT2_LUTLO
MDNLSTKLNSILEMRIDTDKEMLDSLKDLDNFFVENTVQTRRQLRSEIEKRSLKINEDFLASFRSVKQSLDEICEGIEQMNGNVDKMRARLKATQSQTQDLIQQTNSLQEESNKLQFRQKVAGAFLARFQLSPAEQQILCGSARDVPITGEFFTVLDRLQAIHGDCRVLMQCGHHTAALDIMEEMNLMKESALERLYRWTQNHCRNIDANEIGPLVMQAMNRLQDRPVLFKYVIDEYATARRAILVRNFIDALTVGGPGGNPKPIEMHAQDPKRYVGDMFAWLHQAIPSERENLLNLVKLCDQADLTDQIQVALANIADGVCHPLEVRVQMILSGEKQTIVLYAVANLIRFYQGVINGVVHGGNLEQCLASMQQNSEQAYLGSLQQQVKNLLVGPMGTTIEPPQSDLAPPKSVSILLGIMKEILSVASMVEGRQSDIKKIVSCVIDPLLRTITESASHLPTVDMAVYLLNCLYQMQSTLAVYEYMEERIERLQAQSDAQIDTLTSEQASSLVANLNLGPIYTLLQSHASKFEVGSLKMFNAKLDTFLEMPDILLLQQMNLLQSSNHRAVVRKRSFNVIIAIYRQLYEKVHDPENGYDNPGSLFSRSPEQTMEGQDLSKPPTKGSQSLQLPDAGFRTKRTRTASTSARALENPVERGTIKSFCRSKGHGFVTPQSGGEDIFVHISDIEGEYVPLPGDEVSYRLCFIPPKYEKTQAIHVNITNLTPEQIVVNIEGEYVPLPGDEVSYRLCFIPPKYEKTQAIHVNITNLTPEVHTRWEEPPYQ